jgi:hypothetical protein
VARRLHRKLEKRRKALKQDGRYYDEVLMAKDLKAD